MTIITSRVDQLLLEYRMNISSEEKSFTDANIKRVDALLHAIEAGRNLSELKSIIKSAPNKGEVTSEHGTYKGWRDFCEQKDICYRTTYDYIFMYEHCRELNELRLISKDPEDLASGAAGHRKTAAIAAVKWYLKLIQEQGEGVRGTVTAADYQAHKSKLAELGAQAVDNINIKLEQYFAIMSELNTLRKENEELKAKLPISHQ